MTISFSADECQSAFLGLNSTIKDAAQSLSQSSLRICLVLDSDSHLLGIISDGDIRRGLLRNCNMSSSIREIINKSPLVVPSGLTNESIYKMMIANNIFVIPEVDDSNRVVSLHSIGDDHSRINDLTMVVMAGGRGKRLQPYTDSCPKPMLPIKGKPMLEYIIRQAKEEGITKFILSVNYLSELIQDYFQDGSSFDVSISYIEESTPLGTAGSLSLFQDRPSSPFIVTNCDVITDIKYSSVSEFHHRQNAIATMAVRTHEIKNPFGVVQLDGLNIVGFQEKPLYTDYINAGVYCISPLALDYLQYNEYCDMPSFFKTLQDSNHKILAYPMHEPWLDVGRRDDLIKLDNNY